MNIEISKWNEYQEIIKKSEIAYLSTVNADGYPQMRAVFNLCNPNDFPTLKTFFNFKIEEFRILISTNTSSEKIKELRQNPKVGVYYCIPEKFQGIFMGGNINFIDDIEFKKKFWVEGWERYYFEGPTDPDYTLIELKPTLIHGWNKSSKFKFQQE